MKKISALLVVVCLLVAQVSYALAGDVKVLTVKPFVYQKTIMVDDENKQAAKAIGGMGGGMAAGTATGCVVGGPIGCVIGFLGGMYAGGAAGAVAAGTTKQIEKVVKVSGYMVTFDNGQTILTAQKYAKGQKLPAEKIVYDKVI